MTTDKGLMVWLPLTDANHCENQGLVGKLTCTTTPTFVDGGKLGKCLSTGAYQMSAEQTTKVFNNNHLTIAFWVYIDAATGASTPRSVFIGNEEMNANNNRKFTIMQFPTVNDLHYSWMNDAASNTFISGIIKDVLPSYKWTHVAITYENPTAIIYINGVEVRRDTGVSNSSTFAYTTPIKGKRINDFRIYSYALSPQEIKELSRGKVGHWLGDGNGTFLPNVLGTPMVIYQYYTKLSNNNWDISQRGSSGFVRFQNLGMNGVAGPWVVSFTAWASTEYTTNIDLCDVGNKQIKIKTTPSKFFITATARNYYQTNDYNGFLDIGMPTSIPKLYIRDLKMEKGIIPSLYSASNQAFLSDISGFGRHGNITGGITLSSDTKRYDKSLNFSTSDGRAYASIVQPISNSPSAMTIAFWIKPDSASASNYRQCFSFNNGSNWLSINTEGFKVWFYQGATLYVTSSNGTLDSNWHHIAMVWNGSQYQFYIDGIADTTTCTSATNNTLNIVAPQISTFIIGNNSIWTYNNGRLFKDYLSDIRLYATALSADDVKELYSLGH